MKYIYDTDTDIFLGPIPDIAKTCTAYEINADQVLSKLQPEINTGIIPCTDSGLISYRSKYGYEQLVIQVSPGVYTVRWGYAERDQNAKLYEFAMPYRIIIADFNQGAFLGLRHFFTLSPAYTLDTPLYATGFANTNNRGYRQTSVGWTCLYQTRTTPFEDLAEKIDYCITRESGFNEPYNDVNMSATDGPGFYRDHLPSKKHFHSKEQWAAWTKEFGMSQVFDPDMYIQYCVDTSDAQYAQSHLANGKGTLYTLGDAMYKNYAPYYGMTTVKPINGGRGDAQNFAGVIRLAGSTTAKKWVPPVVKAEEKLPTKLAQAKAKVEHLLDGKQCPICKKLRPHNETFDQAISGWTEKGTPEMTGVCTECKSKRVVIFDWRGYKNYGLKMALLRSQSFEMWLAPSEAVQCDYCGDAAPLAQSDNFLVYGTSIEKHEACTNCFNSCFVGDEEEYGDDWMSPEEGLVRDARSNRLIWHEYAVIVDALSPSSDGSLAIQKTFAHVSYAKNVCKCGLFVSNPDEDCLKEKNENGTYTCHSCVDKPLIAVDNLTPVAIKPKDNND